MEPFKIPSGSMIPTLLIGDHIFVAKSAYDLGIPFTSIPLVRIAEPKRGDVVVFRYPNPEQSDRQEGLNYIKRVIGVPGDQIKVEGGIPHINGNPVLQESKGDSSAMTQIPGFQGDPGNSLARESLPESKNAAHWIQRYDSQLSDLNLSFDQYEAIAGRRCVEIGESKRFDSRVFSPVLLNNVCTFKVPADSYFVMGDNRDGSSDGRDWGFVERKYLKGKALFIWASVVFDGLMPSQVRLSRIGLPIE